MTVKIDGRFAWPPRVGEYIWMKRKQYRVVSIHRSIAKVVPV